MQQSGVPLRRFYYGSAIFANAKSGLLAHKDVLIVIKKKKRREVI